VPKNKILFTKLAKKDIQKLDSQVRNRIYKKLKYFLAQKDPLKFAEALKKPADANYRWRVGNYRILFDQKNDTYIILKIQHRREVYGKK
jgi:mRNA interferase RelE/StbE